jgi:uroporphyrinogen-III synthase
MQPLDGISVLVTRPLDQNESLARAIEEQGGLAIRAPMIIISGLSDDSPARKVVAGMKKTDIAIFVSKNAAEFGLELVAREGVSLQGKAIFAVGLGTAGQLARLGVDGVQAPSSEFSSEALLRLEGLDEQHVKGKRIVIFRGLGGREHLAKTLERRGAEVAYCECYERRKPDVAIAAELKKNAVKVPDIGLATSMEALDNLVEKIEEEGVDQLFDMQMLVVGSRVAQEVESLGFTHRPMVVENPSDDSILRRLVKWAEEA